MAVFLSWPSALGDTWLKPTSCLSWLKMRGPERPESFRIYFPYPDQSHGSQPYVSANPYPIRGIRGLSSHEFSHLLPLWAFSRLGSWCVCEHGNHWYTLTHPTLGSPFSHSLRAICTVLLDPRDPLLHSERVQGFAADPVYGRAKCLPMLGSLKT